MNANDFSQLFLGLHWILTVVALGAAALGVGAFIREALIERHRHQALTGGLDQLSVFDE